MPNTWKEIKIFKDELLARNIPKKIILKGKTPESDFDTEYFSLFSGNYRSLTDCYLIYWHLSSQKKKF